MSGATRWMETHGRDPLSNPKLIIGLAGGIGSGKSTVARLMDTLGGYVIDADAIARQALTLPEVRSQLVAWWGESILDATGNPDRAAIAKRVFTDPAERQRLEGVIHPIVARRRAELIDVANADPAARFIVLDVPLLFEVGLDKVCDRVIFVEADEKVRQERVQRTRGWDSSELPRRETNQMPLDRKRAISHDIVRCDRDEAHCLAQVRDLLNRILPH